MICLYGFPRIYVEPNRARKWEQILNGVVEKSYSSGVYLAEVIAPPYSRLIRLIVKRCKKFADYFKFKKEFVLAGQASPLKIWVYKNISKKKKMK